MLSEFVNEPFTDFSQEENRNKMLAALEKVASQFEQEYPMFINGEEVFSNQKFQSFNPCDNHQAVGTFQQATKEHVLQAIGAADEAFKTWSKVSAKDRSEYLLKAAAIMRERKFEFSATMVYEVGKNWAEADGDTAEAIDFLEYYAREMIRFDQPQPVTKIESEDNHLRYIPLGVGAVVPPWNFPFAILAGMSSAPMVAGNTIVLKPSSEAPLTGYKFVEIMRELNLPKGVLNFITHDYQHGAEIGEALVTDTDVRFISFTGSKAVGLLINEMAAKRVPGQRWIKRLVAEMGGKDAIIVDNDYDLDEVATGIVKSAFGFQGQKCSACSRAIIHQDVYDELVEKVVAKTKELTVGEVKDNPNMGAVINKMAEERILEYIEIGKQEGQLLTGGNKASDKGFYIEPTIIKDIAPQSRLAQEEVFGPVLAIIKARDFAHALEIANSTEYGLTGAAYSNREEHLKQADEDFFVGNLYLNRGCTGALVGVHPFGGFNMSGTDAKAGGPDHLLQFLQPKLSSRKIK